MTDPVSGLVSLLSCEVRCEKSFRGLLCYPSISEVATSL